MTVNAPPTKHVSIRSAKAHARKSQFANKTKFAEFTVTNQNVAARQEPSRKPMDRAEHTMNFADPIAIAHHNWLALTANVLIRAEQPNLVAVSLMNLNLTISSVFLKKF